MRGIHGNKPQRQSDESGYVQVRQSEGEKDKERDKGQKQMSERVKRR